MARLKKFRACRTSQKTSARSNEEKTNKVTTEAHDLVDLFRSRGVPDRVTIRCLDTILDMADLNEVAMVEVLEQVKMFLRHRLPEPTENAVINLTVLHIMGLIIDCLEEDDSDNYRIHNNY